MTLGENLQNLRRASGLSQEDVAQKLFVSRQSVSKWENGQAEPGVENLKTLAKLYGVSVDVLVGAEEAKAEEKPSVPSDSAYRRLLKFRLAVSVVALLGVVAADEYSDMLLLSEFLVPGAVAMLLGWWVRELWIWVIFMAVEAFSVVLLSVFFGYRSLFMGLLVLFMGIAWLFRLCQRDVQGLFYKEDEIP